MYVRLMLASQVLLLMVVQSCWGLSCLHCSMARCPEELQCPGGKVLEPCRCCFECAKQKGDICGGPFDDSGTCDEGLRCVRSGPRSYSEGVCKEEMDETTTQRPETTTRNRELDFIEWLKSMKWRKN